MPEGTRIVGERTLAWRASQGNVALWIPDDVVLLGSGQVLANKINENPVGTLLLFPKDKSPTAVIISMHGMDPDAAVQLNQAAHAAQKAEALDEDKWEALTHHSSHNGLHAEARAARTFAQALIAIKNKALPGEQAGDNALRAALGASGGHPQLRLVDEQRHEEESRSAIRQAMAELLEEADSERFGGLVKARNTLLPPDQIQITSYWADDLAWLANEKLRQFISQYPVLSTSLFGACLLGDERAQAITDQIRASASTKKAAAAWVQTAPGSGSPKGSNSPPNWWNGAPPGPVENPRASHEYILPALQKIQQVIEGDPQRTGVCVQRLATCDCLASRTMPHLAMMVDKPENIQTLQKLLMSGMMAGAPFNQLSADLKSLTPKHHDQIRSTDFVGRWEWFAGHMIRDLSQIMAWRLKEADPHERPAALCRGLAVDHPDGEDLVHLADRISRKLEQRVRQLPLTQKLKMASDHMEFEAAPGATGGPAQTEQISNWAVAAGSQGLPIDGQDVPNRWVPLLNKLGRERLAKDLDGLGQATELWTAAQLSEEGNDLHHCVGSYAHYCRKGDSSVWHLRANDSKKGTTLEVRVTSDRSGARLSTAQHRGQNNCSPTEGEERLAKTLLASLRQTIANETKLRDEVSVRRAERNIRMTEALPTGYADVIGMLSQQPWVLEDQSCAGFLCSEPAVRLGIPLPLENLTCDLQRRNRVGLYVEKAMSRSNTNQAIRLAAETGNMETLFKNYINRNDDRRITTEMFFEKYRPWLPRAMSGPDLLAATWNIGGHPEEFQEVPGKELIKLAVDRGRAWREERQIRLAILTAQADPEAPEEQAEQAERRNAGQRRRQRRQIAMGDRLGGEALGLDQPLAGNLGRGRRRPAPEPEQAELQVMPAEAVVEAAEAAPM